MVWSQLVFPVAGPSAQRVHSVDGIPGAQVYNRMFSWIVKSCNSLLGPKTKSYDYTTIGILDIFGFEVFDDNSFEQLLINLANEQLQFFFNNHIFSLEVSRAHFMYMDNCVLNHQRKLLPYDEKFSVFLNFD